MTLKGDDETPRKLFQGLRRNSLIAKLSAPRTSRTLESLPLYLTAGQVGELLQISAKTIYRFVKEDLTMPALRIGGSVRFPRERLERWLRDREQGQPRTRRHVLSAVKATPGHASTDERPC